jgi:isopentenyldiphosphate isomerase
VTVSSEHNTITQQNDPDELLEVFDAAGRATGIARSRAAIHLAGDWHQAFHCWIVRPGPELVLQRRSTHKDTFAGFWDVSAAGHWRFGETAEQAARELEEELGLQVDFAALRYFGRERLVRRFANGLIDREHHQVYLLALSLPLSAYRPDPAEVSALAVVRADELVAMLGGERESAQAVEALAVDADGTLTPEPMTIERTLLVPYSGKRLRRILGSAQVNC